MEKKIVGMFVCMLLLVTAVPAGESLKHSVINSLVPNHPLTSMISNWTEMPKLLAFDGAAGDYFGLSVSLSDDTALIGAYNDDDNGDNSGSAYVFIRTGNTWTPQQKILPSDSAAADWFGFSVSLDENTALVGANNDDDNGADSGSVYVFIRTGTTWTQQQKIHASDGAAGDQFGRSVSLDGDTALIGANNDDDNGADSGSVYVFIRTGTTWTQQQKIHASDGAAGDQFGRSVSLDGDTALIGANWDDDNGADSGSAYVFTRTGSTWTQQQKLLTLDGAAGDSFGHSVSLSGDTALISAVYDDDNGSSSGSVYVFTRTGSTWTQQQKLHASDAATGDNFGRSVSLDGDTALIGANWDDDNGADSGSAYVFTRTGSTWTQQQKLLASDGAAGDNFGCSVSLSGDTALIGAYADDDNGVDSGSAYVFTKDSPPAASFTYIPDNPIISDTISFTDTSTDVDGTIVSWFWDFGDGDTSAEQNPIYQFTASGTYSVSLKVIDDDGYSDEISRDITIGNEPRKALIFGRIINLSSEGEYITFQAVSTKVITFAPFSFNPYSSGERIAISKEYKGFVGARFIFILCDILI